MQNGAVTLFRDRVEFDYAVSWLTNREYVMHAIEATNVASFVPQMSHALDFPIQYGRKWNGNLDALNDRVGDIAFDSVAGVGFAFDNYDQLASDDYRLAHSTLDIIAWNSRFHLLFGHRLLALVLSDDPNLQFESLGAQDARWNNIRWGHLD